MTHANTRDDIEDHASRDVSATLTPSVAMELVKRAGYTYRNGWQAPGDSVRHADLAGALTAALVKIAEEDV